MNSPQLYPTILTDSRQVFAEQLDLVKNNGELEVIQVDVIDGQFADNLTLEPWDITEFDFDELKIDFHLQTEEPMDFVNQIIEVKDTLPIRAVIAQVERMSSQQHYLEELEKQELRKGLCLDFYTDLEAIDEESWEKLDIVQLMGNEAGFQGREINEGIFKKISAVKKELESRELEAEVFIDVGVRLSNAKKLVDAGATGICAGSSLWKADNFNQAVDEFHSILR